MPAKKKKKKSSSSSGPLFGIAISPGMWVGLVVVLAGFAVVVYFLSRLAGPSVSADDARFVDAYSVFSVKENNSSSLLLGGNSRLVVVRDNPKGEFLFVRLKMSATFLEKKDKVRNGSISLSTGDFTVDGKAANLLLLDPYVNSSMDIDLLPAKTKDQVLPGTVDLGTPKGTFTPKLDIREEDRNGVETVVAKGTAEFRTPGGMLVEFAYGGRMLRIRWDGQAMGWLARTHYLAAEKLMGNVELACLLPRPAGNAESISVAGQSLKLDIKNK